MTPAHHDSGATAPVASPDPSGRGVDPSLSAYWPVPVLRAVPSLAAAAAITFNPDHSPQVGLLTFGAAAVAGGVVLAVGSALRLHDRSSRTIAVLQGVVGAVIGALCLVFSHGQLPVLVAFVTAWAVLTGGLELLTGLRRRRRSPLARDWTTVGVLTLVLALVFLVVPPDYSQQLGGIEQIEGELTSSTVLVGILGAYGALVGVFLVIAGLSLKWQTGHPAPADTPDDKGRTS